VEPLTRTGERQHIRYQLSIPLRSVTSVVVNEEKLFQKTSYQDQVQDAVRSCVFDPGLLLSDQALHELGSFFLVG